MEAVESAAVTVGVTALGDPCFQSRARENGITSVEKAIDTSSVVAKDELGCDECGTILNGPSTYISRNRTMWTANLPLNVGEMRFKSGRHWGGDRKRSDRVNSVEASTSVFFF